MCQTIVVVHTFLIIQSMETIIMTFKVVSTVTSTFELQWSVPLSIISSMVCRPFLYLAHILPLFGSRYHDETYDTHSSTLCTAS